MRDVSSIRPQTTIFGCESALPIYVSPASNALLGHPDGELNITRGVSPFLLIYLQAERLMVRRLGLG
jgi:isopentenyl diphosphate isomerase/L-lactate dehydrogenase-like FMN-dependent dehydrogenase